MPPHSQIDFTVLFDVALGELHPNAQGLIMQNKHVVSFVNDFEDGEWRFDKFQSFIWDNIAETALSLEERQKLINKSHTQLVESAKKLRLSEDSGRGSEAAEIVLYGIMRHYYNALPVVPKIFYKQNSQDNAKGADSVHIVVDENGFTIWLGEAKFYKSLQQAIPKAIVSIKDLLQTDKLKKEKSIIIGIKEIDNHPDITNDLKREIKQALSPRDSIDNIKPKIHVPILLLYDCESTRNETDFTDTYKRTITDFHKAESKKYFEKHQQEITEQIVHLCSQITFHLILFPVPDSAKIKDKFIITAENYRT